MQNRVHPTDQMTSRQRMLAAYQGREVDRLPYWAKVTNPTWRTGQPEAIRAWSNIELLDYIFADGIFYADSGVRVRRPHVTVETRAGGGQIVRATHTPDGDLQEQWAVDPATQSEHPVVFPVKTVDDLRKFRWVFTDVAFDVDAAALEKSRAFVRATGERGVFVSGWGTSPLMDLVEHVLGPIETHLFLCDHPEEMAELIALMHATNLMHVRAVAHNTPADIVVSVENTSTTLISPGQFETYCHRHLCQYGAAVAAEGKMHELHMCGHLLKLLEKIDTIPAASIEAFTAPTLGATRLVDGRTRAPSKTLIGGTNVNTWLMPVPQIQQYIERELAACPNHRHIVLTTAGVAPPACPAEHFRQIGQWIHTLPVRM